MFTKKIYYLVKIFALLKYIHILKTKITNSKYLTLIPLYLYSRSNLVSPSPRTLLDTDISSSPMSESLEKNGAVGGSTSDYNPLLNRQLENPTS